MSDKLMKQAHEIAATDGEQSGTAGLIRLAVQQGKDFPIETLERLFALHREDRAAQARRAFYEAMSQFQSIAPRLDKVGEVDFTTARGRTRYNFAPLGYISEKLREPLKQCGLSYRFDIADTDKGMRVGCIVTHVAGHSERTEMTASADDSGGKNAIQARGSTVTYLERYTLLSAFGLVTGEEDTDGNPDLNKITADQAAELAKMIADTGADLAKFLRWGGCVKIEQLPASKYGEAVKLLSKKQAKRAAPQRDADGQEIPQGDDAQELPL